MYRVGFMPEILSFSCGRRKELVFLSDAHGRLQWIPAFAGMTERAGMTEIEIPLAPFFKGGMLSPLSFAERGRAEVPGV